MRYTSIEELFWDSLPTYLAIGMSANEFWHGEPRLAESYREAEKIKRENRYIGEWRAGFYVYMAIAASFEKEAEYPPEPIFSTALDDENGRKKREEAAMERQVAQFGALAAVMNEGFASSGD